MFCFHNYRIFCVYAYVLNVVKFLHVCIQVLVIVKQEQWFVFQLTHTGTSKPQTHIILIIHLYRGIAGLGHITVHCFSVAVILLWEFCAHWAFLTSRG